MLAKIPARLSQLQRVTPRISGAEPWEHLPSTTRCRLHFHAPFQKRFKFFLFNRPLVMLSTETWSSVKRTHGGGHCSGEDQTDEAVMKLGAI